MTTGRKALFRENEDEKNTSVLDLWIASEFEARKAQILAGLAGSAKVSKTDRSLKQEIDTKLRPLCALINGLPDYYTLSCCSGRIANFLSNELSNETSELSLKKIGYLNFVAHSREEIPPSFSSILDRIESLKPFYDTLDESKNAGFKADVESMNTATLRFEPVLIHICCKTWKAATNLIQSAREAGIKDVGIMNFSRKGINIKLCGTARLAVPLKIDNTWLFAQNENSLQAIFDRCCHLMDSNDQCIERLYRSFSKNLLIGPES